MWLGNHFQGQKVKGQYRFTHRRVNASGSCSGERGNVLAVGNYYYVAVYSAARGGSVPTEGGEVRGIWWWPPPTAWYWQSRWWRWWYTTWSTQSVYTYTIILHRKFGKCSFTVKIRLFRAYCLGFYDIALWRTYTSLDLWINFSDVIINALRYYTVINANAVI